MKFSVAFLAVAAFGFASAATTTTATASTGVQKPSEAPRPSAITRHGCYNESSTSWTKYPVENISSGACTQECQLNQKKYVAAINGEDCYCGDAYPPESSLDLDTKCNFPCPFYPEEACTSSLPRPN